MMRLLFGSELQATKRAVCSHAEVVSVPAPAVSKQCTASTEPAPFLDNTSCHGVCDAMLLDIPWN